MAVIFRHWRRLAMLAGLLFLLLVDGYLGGGLPDAKFPGDSLLLSMRSATRDPTPPVIDIWYGPRQQFGQPGLAQVWVNVLGRVSDPESKVTRLSYTLNDGPPMPLTIGPDLRRLAMPGDFNVELAPSELLSGENHLLIEAINRGGQITRTEVTLIYTPRADVLPLPYTIHWADVQDPLQVLQIVDGKWRWDAGGIRVVEMGYDRMLNVGDSRWTDYQVTVPVLVHAFDPAGFHDRNSGKQASVAVDLRWVGHSDDPVICPQPKCGWDPVGNFNKFFFREDGNDYLAMKVGEKEKDYPTVPYTFHPGDTYIFTVNVQTVPEGTMYRMKVWEPAYETEPTGWTFERLVPDDNPAHPSPTHGAFALVAHYIDVTFGDITVTKLE